MDTKQKKVLLIDDDAFYCKIYQLELGESEDIDVVCVTNGKEGLEAMRTMKPDLVLLDIVMPDYDGYWLLTEKAKDPQLASIPVIVNSGVASLKDIDKMLSLGAERVFSKLTLSPEQFAQRIRSFLAGDKSILKSAKLVDISMIKEGEKLNDIFAQSAGEIQSALKKMLNSGVDIGNLQATIAPIDVLQSYLEDFMSDEKESTVVYSVLNPPIAAALLLIRNSTVQQVVNMLKSTDASDDVVVGAIKEVYSIVANTFLTTLTGIFGTGRAYMFKPSMLVTPDLALDVLRKDGFITSESKIHFLFRQQYLIGEQAIMFDFILFLHKKGLEELGGGRLNSNA